VASGLQSFDGARLQLCQLQLQQPFLSRAPPGQQASHISHCLLFQLQLMQQQQQQQQDRLLLLLLL
jgi:hypothetical protein